MKKPLYNKGLHTYRFKDNPLEEAFAKEWEKYIRSLPADKIIDYLKLDSVKESLEIKE
jgi:hypothetical protein